MTHSLWNLVETSELESRILFRVGHQRHERWVRRAETYEGEVRMRQDGEVHVHVCLSRVMRRDQDGARYMSVNRNCNNYWENLSYTL